MTSSDPGPSAELEHHTRGGEQVAVGPLRNGDRQGLFDLFDEIVASGDGFPHEPPLDAETFAATWIDPVTMTVCARISEEPVGAYYLKPNFVGRARHIANAGYVVARRHRRKGIGRLLVEDSICRAPLLGFDAIQFNLVFASNPARALYEELGWVCLGRIPEAVGAEDCFIYWRRVP